MNAKELERLAVVRKIVDKHLTQVLAAKHLGLTERQVKRLVKKYTVARLFQPSAKSGFLRMISLKVKKELYK